MKQLSLCVIGIAVSMLCVPICAELFFGLEQCKDSAYRRDIYPFDQSLLLDLIKYANTVNEPKTYIRAVLKFFINIAKDTYYIDAESFSTVLEQFATLLPEHFTSHAYQDYLQHPVNQLDMLNRLKKINTQILLQNLTTNYAQMRTEPALFVDNLAQQLAQVGQEELDLARLKFTFMMFLEIHLNKLIWSPDDQIETWQLTKKIANQCAALVEKNVLDDLNDLDDLYWTLIHRYGYFVHLTHTLLNDDLFNSIKYDISRHNIHLFELEEQESCIAKRAECLLEAIMAAQAKKAAYERGIIGR
jgi:hypothetical protein